MNQPFEERYLDVLQNIEAAIVRVYRERAELLDSQVDAALEALIGRYTAEQRGGTPRPVPLDGARREVHAALEAICEWRLGRTALGSPGAPLPPALAVDEMVACLKRVRKSVQRFTKQRGRQGYLQFVSGFV